jgi:trigger factor
MQSSFAEAVVQQQLTPAGGPRIEPISTEGGDLKYRAVFEIFPQIQLKGIDGMEIERPAADVSDADVDAMIINLQEQRPSYVGVDREAGETDRVTVDFDGSIDGQPFEGGKGADVPVVLGAGRMLADFEAGLKGVRAGDKKTIDVTFPANYPTVGLAGKRAQFALEVKSVEERKLPELDDAFCKSYGVDEGGIERLREEVRDNMTRELADAVSARVKKQIMDALLAANPFELPKSVVDSQVREMQLEAARRQGAKDASQIPPPEPFLEPARRRVALTLLINEVVKAGGLSVDQTQVQTRIHEVAQQYPDANQALQTIRGNPQVRRQIEASVLEDQAVNWLLERAKIADQRATFKEIMNFGA